MYLLGIITCEKNRPNINKIKNTWISTLNLSLYNYYFILGHPEIEEEYRFDENTKELWVKTGDNYEDLTEKVRMMFYAFAVHFQNKNIKGVYKIDDDIYVRSSSLETLNNVLIDYGGYLVNLKKIAFSSHHFGKCTNKKLNTMYVINPKTVYCAGPLYYLSIRAVNLFQIYKNVIMTSLYEDISIGMFLLCNDIGLTSMDLHTINKEDWLNKKKIVGFHDATHTCDFYELFKLVK